MRCAVRYLCVCLAVLILSGLPGSAHALGTSTYTQLYCNANGTVGKDINNRPSQLFYADYANNAGACEYDGFMNGRFYIFGTIICQFVLILDAVLGSVYCGIQYGIASIIGPLLTLYVVVFGMQLLMGTAQLTPRDVLIRLLKIGGVIAFTTQSTWGIGLAFNFFVGLMTSGTYWVTKWVLPETSTDLMPAYAYIDTLIYNAIAGPFTNSNQSVNFKVVGLLVAMAYTLPPVAMLAGFWLYNTVRLLASTLISFMLGLSAVAFLISLSPIFLSLMLFKATYNFFESWLRYMISFSLQIIVVFSIVAMWIYVMLSFGDFFSSLSNIIVPWESVVREGGPTASPDVTWALCPYSYTVDSTTFVPIPYLTCTNPNFDPIDNPADAGIAILPSEFALHPDLLYFMVYNLVALLLVAKAFYTMLENAPQIARELVGPEQAPALAPGWGGMKGFGKPEGTPNQSKQFGQRHNVASSGFTSRAGRAGGGAIADIVARAHEQASKRGG